MINITTTDGQPILLGLDMIREISDKGGVSTITLKKGNQTYKTASTLDQIKAQAFKNLFVKVTDGQGVNFLLFAYRILKVVPSGSGSSIEFNDGTPNKVVTQNAAAIMASFSDTASLGLPYTGSNGVQVVGNDIRLGANPLTGNTAIGLAAYELLIGALSLYQGSANFGTSTPIASALVNMASTTKGLLIPRMTSAQRTAIPGPANGLQVYDTTTKSVWYFDSNNSPTWQQNVSKEYVDAALLNVMRVIGALDCSANPNYPAATQGDAYYISVNGKIGGALGPDVHVGDYILCITTTVAGDQATVGSKWIIVEDTAGQATTAILGLVRLATAAEASAQVVTDKAVTPSALTGYQRKQRTANMMMRNASGTTFNAPLNTWTKVSNALSDNTLSGHADFSMPVANRLQYNGANPINLKIRFGFTNRRVGAPTPTGSVGIAVSGNTGIGSVVDLNRINAIAFNQGTGELGFSKEYEIVTLTNGQYLEFYIRNETTAGTVTMIFGNYYLYVEEII